MQLGTIERQSLILMLLGGRNFFCSVTRLTNAEKTKHYQPTNNLDKVSFLEE